MPSRLAVIFCLDAGLFLSFCALESVPLTGMILHEWLGIVLIAMIVAHLLFSWSWIASASRKLATPRSNRTRVNYLLNLALFATVTAVIFSGILISQEAMPYMTGRKAAPLDSDFAWTHLHDEFSNYVFIFAGLHLAINWKWTVAAVRKLLRRDQGQA
jgi:cytochrome b561